MRKSISLSATVCYSVDNIIFNYRPKVATSHRTFPPIICWSVCVCLSLCPVHCEKTANQIWKQFGMVGQIGPVMSQVVGFGDWMTGEGNFWGECGHRIVTNGEYLALRPLP